MPNADLPGMIPERQSTFVYYGPRFICGGEKIVVSVLDKEARENVAVAVYDIAAGKISAMQTIMPPYHAEYPFSDRYIAVRNLSPISIIDAETGEVTELPKMGIARVCDEKTVIISDYASLDANNAPAYVCDINNPDDRSRPLLRARQPKAQVNLPDVTENYAVFSVSDFDGDWIAAAKYR
jgi:hypothetical protein